MKKMSDANVIWQKSAERKETTAVPLFYAIPYVILVFKQDILLLPDKGIMHWMRLSGNLKKLPDLI